MFNVGERAKYQGHLCTIIKIETDMVLVKFDEKWSNILHGAGEFDEELYYYVNWVNLEKAIEEKEVDKGVVKVDLKQSVNKVYEELFANKTEYNQLLEAIKDREEKVEYHRIELKKILEKLKTDQAKLAGLKPTIFVDYYSKIMEINRSTKIKKLVVMEEGVIIATTENLYATATNGSVYDVGEFEITYEPSDGSIRFINITEEKRRRSCWGNKCHHPHVSVTGNACLGSASEMLAYLSSDHEYGAMFDILIAFLESINLNDVAGRHAMNWDKVDPDTKEIVREGYRDKEADNFSYGDSPEDEEFCEDEGSYYCECCEEGGFREDNIAYISGEDRYVCNDCLDEYYVRCTHCNEYIHYDDTTCTDNGVVCQVCLEDEYTYCEHCEEYKLSDNVVFIDGVGKNVCDECLEIGFVLCEICEEHHHTDKIAHYDSIGKYVCEDCLSDKFKLCPHCDEYISVDGDMYITLDEQEVCEFCFNQITGNEEN